MDAGYQNHIRPTPKEGRVIANMADPLEQISGASHDLETIERIQATHAFGLGAIAP